MANEQFEIEFAVDGGVMVALDTVEHKQDREAWDASYKLVGTPEKPILICSSQGGYTWKGCDVYHRRTSKKIVEFYKLEELADDAPSEGILTDEACLVGEGSIRVHYKDWEVTRVEVELSCGLEDLGFPIPY